MTRDGWLQPASPTTRAGTPATVVLGGTSLSTTLPAAMRAQSPTTMFPRISGAGSDHDAASHLGMTVARLLAAAAECHVMQERAVVPDFGCLSDHDSVAVVEHDPAPDLRRRVNVDAEHARGLALEIERKVLSAGMPKRMTESLGLKRVEPLEIQKRIDKPAAGGIAVVDGG